MDFVTRMGRTEKFSRTVGGQKKLSTLFKIVVTMIFCKLSFEFCCFCSFLFDKIHLLIKALYYTFCNGQTFQHDFFPYDYVIVC